MLDGAEFVGPGTDIALRLYDVAPCCYYPGFNKPNGTGECIVALKMWNALGDGLKAIVAHACAAEANYALSEMERLNAEALAVLTKDHGVKLAAFSRRPRRGGAPGGRGRARRHGRRQRHCRQDRRLLLSLPRAHGALVAGVDRGGIKGEGSVRPRAQGRCRG